MFDFQKLEVYKKSKIFHISCKKLISDYALDSFVKDQLGRASFSIPLNIAEGSGVFSKPYRKNYFTTARASVFECVAILDILSDEAKRPAEVVEQYQKQADELSRILFSMIKNLAR
jgi:four helix bundle protein